VCFTLLLKPVIPVLGYILNYEYISSELCVNRETPIMGCNGKCYLMKELAKASESEKPQSSNKKQATAETNDLFVTAIDYYDFQNTPVTFPNPVQPQYSNLYASLNLDTVFHPPTRIS